MENLKISISDVEYDVFIARDLKEYIANFVSVTSRNRKVLIVTDNYFKHHYANDLSVQLGGFGFDVQLYVMSGGKISKTFNEVLKIFGVLETNDYARDSLLVALGGGVIGDLAGFVASTWYRGMYMIHVPTTLMAMVDSSIGGKVAINFRETINAVGTYYHPIANFMDVDLIDTLPERDYISGLAEIVKCGLIADINFLDYIKKNHEKILSRDFDKLVYCIRRAIEIKVEHVKNDVKEGGKRLLLNYGHTLGHAIEMATHAEKGETFRHGEGVSLGISAALLLSEFHLDLSRESIDYTRSLLRSLRLPTQFSASEIGYDRQSLIEQCMKLIQKDKKRKDHQLRFVLIDDLGHACTHTGISPELIRRAFEYVIME